VKGFISDADPAFATDGAEPSAADPGLAAAMEFLKWNKGFKEREPEAHFAAELKRREAAQKARAVAPQKLDTADQLAAALEQIDRPTVLVFGAKACRMCRMVQPKLERVAAQAGAKLLYMHYDKQSEDAYHAHGVTATPTVHLYDGAGELVSAEVYKMKDVPKMAKALAAL
jgi:thiol-disulfide isomerase/thioredoxin